MEILSCELSLFILPSTVNTRASDINIESGWDKMSNIAGSRLGNEVDDDMEVAEEAEGQNFRKKLMGDPVMY